MPSWTLDAFDGGLDVRDGQFSMKQNRFRELKNRYVTLGKKLARRMPLKQVDGLFGSDTTGVIIKDSVIYTLAPLGGGATLPTGVVVLAYDPPPGTSTTTLVDVVTLNSVPIALLKHTIGTAFFYAMHVFDNDPNQFTYINDVGFPWTTQVNPTIRPCLGVSAGKVFCGGPTGDAAFSGVTKPRVWNLRTTDDLQLNGREFIFYIGSAGSQSITVPVGDDCALTQNSGYTGVIVQKFNGAASDDFSDNSKWGSFSGVTGGVLTDVSNGSNTVPPANQVAWYITANTKPGATVTTFQKVNINPAAGGVWYRIRLQAPIDTTPGYRVNDVISGAFRPLNVTGNGTITTTGYGDGAKTVFKLPDNFIYTAAGANWEVKINGVVQTAPTNYTLAASGNLTALTFVAVVPAGGLYEVNQRFSFPGSLVVVIPPGTVRTFAGTKTYLGGKVTLPANQSGNVYIPIDSNGEPSGLAFFGGAGATYFNKSLQYFGILIGFFTTDATGVTSTSFSFFQDNRNRINDLAIYRAGRALAGFNDAGYLPTSKQASGGGLITDLTGTKDRLLVRYAAGSQVWSIHANPTLDGIISLIPVGSGEQPAPAGVLFYEQTVIVPASTGIRAVSLTAQLVGDSIHDDQDIGEAVTGLGTIVFQAGAFWPKMGMYLAAVTINGTFGMLVFVYQQGGKIAAWSQFTFTGLTSVDARGMTALNDRLYVRSGTSFFYLDASAIAGQFFDYNETAETGFTDRTVSYFNDMKQPSLMKNADRIDVHQTGKATFRCKINPYNEAFESSGLVIDGTTSGRGIVPFCAAGLGLSLVIESTDPNGHQLDRLSLEYRVAKR